MTAATPVNQIVHNEHPCQYIRTIRNGRGKLPVSGGSGTPPAADWKRPPGRPRRNWLQKVEEDIGPSVGAAWIAGQDRSMWRTLRPSAGQAQQ